MNFIAASLFFAPFGTTSASAAVMFWSQDVSTVTPVAASAVRRPFQNDAERASAEASSCCDCAPPIHQMISYLDGIEFLEGAVEIERIELVRRYAVGKKRGLDHAGRRPFVKSALSGKLCCVEQIRPCLRAGADGILVAADDEGIIEAADASSRLRSADRAWTCRSTEKSSFLEQAVVAGLNGIVALHVDDIPG